MITPTGYKFHHVKKKKKKKKKKKSTIFVIWNEFGVSFTGPSQLTRAQRFPPSSIISTQRHSAERKSVFVTLSQMYRSLIAKPVLSPADKAVFL